MTIDLSVTPWDRLAKLAPPSTPTNDLQTAAQRWAITADVYGAAADLWEEKLMGIDLGPDPDSTFDANNPMSGGRVQSVSQDGISINFAVSALSGETQTSRLAQASQIRGIIRGLRAKQKPHSPLIHSRDYNPWLNRRRCTCYGDGTCGYCCETIVVVDGV